MIYVFLGCLCIRVFHLALPFITFRYLRDSWWAKQMEPETIPLSKLRWQWEFTIFTGRYIFKSLFFHCHVHFSRVQINLISKFEISSSSIQVAVQLSAMKEKRFKGLKFLLGEISSKAREKKERLKKSVRHGKSYFLAQEILRFWFCLKNL